MISERTLALLAFFLFLVSPPHNIIASAFPLVNTNNNSSSTDNNDDVHDAAADYDNNYDDSPSSLLLLNDDVPVTTASAATPTSTIQDDKLTAVSLPQLRMAAQYLMNEAADIINRTLENNDDFMLPPIIKHKNNNNDDDADNDEVRPSKFIRAETMVCTVVASPTPTIVCYNIDVLDIRFDAATECSPDRSTCSRPLLFPSSSD